MNAPLPDPAVPGPLDPVPGPADPVSPLKAVQDTFISAIRTAFPAWWIGIVVWLLAKVPVLENFRDWLYGPAQALVLAALVFGIRYVFGFIEKKKWIPNWVSVILLGNANRPLYVAPPVADAVNDGQTVPVVAEKGSLAS